MTAAGKGAAHGALSGAFGLKADGGGTAAAPNPRRPRATPLEILATTYSLPPLCRLSPVTTVDAHFGVRFPAFGQNA